MALGATVGAPAFGQSQTISNALIRARLTGQPVALTGQSGLSPSLLVYPNGTIGGTPGGGYGVAPQGYTGVQGAAGSPSGAAVTITTPSIPPAQAPLNQANPNFTAGIQGASGTQAGAAPAYVQPPTQVQAPLNQINPNTTYVSPNTAQPATAVPVVGQTGTQSGQPILATQARNYRAQHGLSDGSAADALNAESLVAARAGRTYLDPTLAAQSARLQAAGYGGPANDVVNALVMPPAATQTAALSPQYAQNNALLAQGTY